MTAASPWDRRRLRPTTDHRATLCKDAGDILAGLARSLPELAERVRHGFRDGYATTSQPEAHGKGGHGDPTGALATDHVEADEQGRPRDPLKAALDEADAALLQAVRLLSMAEGAVLRTAPPSADPGAGDPGCKLHTRAGAGWREVRAKGICRACADFIRSRGREPTPQELRHLESKGKWPKRQEPTAHAA